MHEIIRVHAGNERATASRPAGVEGLDQAARRRLDEVKTRVTRCELAGAGHRIVL